MGLHLRFQGICYRAHDPKWSHLPLSGDGAAASGGRFNPKGIPALYLSLSVETALIEVAAANPFTCGPGVDGKNCAEISISSTPLVRERGRRLTDSIQRNQCFDRDVTLMCH
jgi:RES domain-containing protein